MPNPKSAEMVHKALAALERGEVERARVTAQAAVRADNGNAAAFSVLGVTLVREAKPEQATEAFRKAVFLAPTDARIAFNLAAHQFALGNIRQARDVVVECLKDDPAFEEGKALLKRIDEQQHEGTVEFILPEVTLPQWEPVEGEEPHVLPFMRGMERSWTRVGWAFVAVALIAMIGLLLFQPFIMSAVDKGAGTPPIEFKRDAGSILTIFLLVVSGIFSIVWMLVDIVDRKMRLVWLVPAVACCTCGLHGLPHALYMFMRRT
jgi:hypothetical protein